MATDPNAPGDTTYRASKKYAEMAAWEFMEENELTWDLATICNTYTFGPLPRSLDVSNGGQAKVNTSNQRIVDCLQGKWAEKIPPTAPVFTFVDVRDVAVAHVRAMVRPEAGGKRFYVVGGTFSNPFIAAIVHSASLSPELQGRPYRYSGYCKRCLTLDDYPNRHWRFDNWRSKRVLGMEYREIDQSVADTVLSLRRMGIVGGEYPVIAGHRTPADTTLPN